MKLKMKFVFDMIEIRSVKAEQDEEFTGERGLYVLSVNSRPRFHLCSLKTRKKISGSASFFSFDRVLSSSIRLIFSIVL